MSQVREWLASYSWEFVTAQNMLLCKAQNALHKPTSSGHQKTMAIWESRYLEPMTLIDAVELCRKCHRLAPICFYNGNTFAGIIRDVVNSIGLPPQETIIVRSLAGHIVAGVADEFKEEEFRKICELL